jgi:ParB family transcriptional regulator, chromosome partitioning protein
VTLSPTADPVEIDSTGFDFEFVPGGVDPKTLKIHSNVRIDPRVKEDAEFLASVRDRGVRTAISAYRDAGGELVVLRGQRRTLAAVLTGRPRVPVLIEPEPDEATRLSDQVIENDQRVELRAAEHVAAYEQMEALGFTAEQIAERLATKPEQVRAGLSVARSPKAAQAIAAMPEEVDLFRGAVFAEFADDPQALGQLEVAARRGGWDHTVQRMRDARALKMARAAKEAELKEQGFYVLVGVDYVSHYDAKIRPVDRIWDPAPVASGKKKGEKRRYTAAKHQKECKGHAVYADSKYLGRDDNGGQQYDFDVVHVCRDVVKHKHDLAEPVLSGSGKTKLADMEPDEAAKERAERRKVKANNAAMRSATELRVKFVAALANRKKLPVGAGKMMAAAAFRDRDKLRFSLERGSRAAHTMFGLPPQDYRTHDDFVKLADDVSDVRGELMALVVLLAAYEDNMGDDCWRVQDGGRNRYLLFLKSCGYELSPVEEMAAGLRDVVNVETLIQDAS